MLILCIDSSVLKTSPDVQKDVDLEDLINNHTKYFNSEQEALDEKYVPLDFSTSVRSMYSNLVLQSDKEEGKRYYTNLTKIQPFIHKGYDLVMYLTSIGLMYNVDFDLGFDDVMQKHSQFQPIGLYNPDPTLVNPIIYSHIILSDEGAEEFKKFLKSNRKWVSISDMKESSEGNIKALLDTLIEVKKGEDSDEQSDNNTERI